MFLSFVFPDHERPTSSESKISQLLSFMPTQNNINTIPA